MSTQTLTLNTKIAGYTILSGIYWIENAVRMAVIPAVIDKAETVWVNLVYGYRVVCSSTLSGWYAVKGAVKNLLRAASDAIVVPK